MLKIRTICLLLASVAYITVSFGGFFACIGEDGVQIEPLWSGECVASSTQSGENEYASVSSAGCGDCTDHHIGLILANAMQNRAKSYNDGLIAAMVSTLRISDIENSYTQHNINTFLDNNTSFPSPLTGIVLLI